MSMGRIAIELGRHRSTVSRELRRNANGCGRYYSGHAHRLAVGRRRIVRRMKKLSYEPLRRSVERGLDLGWSPEQISGRRDRKRMAPISRMTIYRHVDEHVERLGATLPEGKKRKKKAERIHDRVMIDERPSIVDRRERPGDWESDTLRGPMNTKACVATHLERMCYYLVARLLEERKSEQMNRETAEAMKGLPVHTLTVDNGMEFASFKKLEEMLDARVYFAHKKSPWERARVELTNRYLRRYFPRGTDFSQVSPTQLRRAVTSLNNRPRKALGYKTPKEAMKELGVALGS